MIAPQRLVTIPFVLLPLMMGLTACSDEDDHSNESSDASELVTIISTTTPPPTSTVVEETTEVVTVYADGNGNVTGTTSGGTQNSGSSVPSNPVGVWFWRGMRLQLDAGGSGNLHLSTGAVAFKEYAVSWSGTDTEVQVTLLELLDSATVEASPVSDLDTGDVFIGRIENTRMYLQGTGEKEVRGWLCRTGEGGYPADESDCNW